MVVLVIIAVSVGCSVNKDRFDVTGIAKEENNNEFIINTTDDIKNIVTDDDKLVINYFDAYTWIILFNEYNKPSHMVYVYKFEDSKTAIEMADVRRNELEKNRSMVILASRAIDDFVVVDLLDSSFDNVTREVLENNFSGLIVY